ncbi:glutamate--cysteine ligase [Streptomyces sp. enrichment culture]|uniref:glutamate--cysteine ligase n=1 Tax=Streptomyces sp. enrichment culture TaxID=1795815 RepID=UPI003F56B994
MSLITVGVEEEYVLLDATTWLPVPAAARVRAAAGLAPSVQESELQDELLRVQLEVATPVCSTLDEVGGHLLRLREALAAAAEAQGCRLAATGTPPLREHKPPSVTDGARYRAMSEQAPQLVAEQLINGMHIHAAVPDSEVGIAVLNRIRPWLPVLVAMSANSPFWDGEDTGFASWRTIVFGRWHVSGPPPHFESLADYEQRVERLLDTGTIMDRGQLYWQARLSDRYPTIEVRCPDVQLRAEEAVMLAGVVRGLVATAIADVKASAPLAVLPPELLQAANWHAARRGLSGSLIDPEGRRRSAGDVLAALLEHIAPALDASGDTRQVTSLVHRLLREGTPADRQREARAQGGLGRVAQMVINETAGW